MAPSWMWLTSLLGLLANIECGCGWQTFSLRPGDRTPFCVGYGGGHHSSGFSEIPDDGRTKEGKEGEREKSTSQLSIYLCVPKAWFLCPSLHWLFSVVPGHGKCPGTPFPKSRLTPFLYLLCQHDIYISSIPLQAWGKRMGFGSWSKPGRWRDWIPAKSQEQVGVQLPNDISWALTNLNPRQTAHSTRRERDWQLAEREAGERGGNGNLEKDKVRKKMQRTQPNGPESLPHLQNQKHLLIASKRQRGSVSLSAAVIPHSDEHLKCQDPFQQLCTSNQAFSSVTAMSQPLHLSP